MNADQHIEPVVVSRPQSASGLLKRNGLIAILFLLLLFKFWNLYLTLDKIPEHVDESIHVQGAYFYKLFFLDWDFNNPDWNNFISYDETPIGKYLLGFALELGNRKIIDSSGGQMDWHRRCVTDWFKWPLVARTASLSGPESITNQKLINYCEDILSQLKFAPATPIDRNDYHICRLTVLFFGLLTTGLLIWISFHLSQNWAISMFAGWVFINNRVTLPGFQQVMLDSFWCFFVLLSLFFLFNLFRERFSSPINGRIVWLAILEGAALSLAMGTKLIAIYMVITVGISFLAMMVLTIYRAKKAGREFPMENLVIQITVFVLISTSAGLIFILFNPFLYHDFISHGLKLFHHRDCIMQIQSAVQGPAIHSFSERTGAIFRFGILMGYNVDGTFNRLCALGYIGILVIGLKKLAHNASVEFSGEKLGLYSIALIWILCAFVVIGASVSMQWERYFLPLVMCSVVLFALGLTKIFEFGTQASHKRVKAGQNHSVSSGTDG